MEQPFFGFEKLEVWRKARFLCKKITHVVQTFPSDERFRISDQMIRASRSVATQIAEGHGRYTFKEQMRYCIQARGSLTELVNHLIQCRDIDLICDDQLYNLKTACKEIELMLNAYIQYLRNRANNSKTTQTNV